MTAIEKVESFVFEAPAWKLVLAIALLTVFKTGVWYIPNLSISLEIAQNPFRNPFDDPNLHYLFWSWLGPYLAWLIGATGRWSFLALHLFFSVAFTLLFIRVVFQLLPDRLARSSLVLLSILPVSATAYFWVSSDSITLFLMLLALAYPRAPVFTLLMGLLLGMQHFEQAFFAAGGLLCAITLSQRQGHTLLHTRAFCFALVTGVVAGKLLLLGLFHYHAIEVNSGRMHWLRAHLDTLLKQFFFHFHYIVWSVLGLGWLVALRFTDWGRQSLPFFLVLAALCLLLPVSGDQTRVLAIITFPLVAAYWLLNRDFLESISRRELTWLFVAWALMPWGWVVGGSPKWSAFPYDMAYLLHQLFGWFSVPDNLAHWPFRTP